MADSTEYFPNYSASLSDRSKTLREQKYNTEENTEESQVNTHPNLTNRQWGSMLNNERKRRGE